MRIFFMFALIVQLQGVGSSIVHFLHYYKGLASKESSGDTVSPASQDDLLRLFTEWHSTREPHYLRMIRLSINLVREEEDWEARQFLAQLAQELHDNPGKLQRGDDG